MIRLNRPVVYWCWVLGERPGDPLTPTLAVSWTLTIGPLELKLVKPAMRPWRPRYTVYVGGTGRWCRMWTAGWFIAHWLGGPAARPGAG